MNRLLAASFIFVFGLAFAHAQTAPEAPPPSAPQAAPPSGAAPGGPPAGGPPRMQPSGKEVRAQCQAQADAQGLEGPARKAAVQDCFAKARPDLAKRQQCRAQGKAQGLADQQLRQFVKQCAAGA